MFKDERVRAITASLLILVVIGFFIRVKLQDQIVDYDDVEMVYNTSEVVRFKSAEEFKNYLAEVSNLSSYGGDFRTQDVFSVDAMAVAESDGRNAVGSATKSTSPDRVSQTNVQVAGIDEPDIIKTDGQSIYYASQPEYWGYFPDDILMIEPSVLEREEAAVSNKATPAEVPAEDVDPGIIEKISQLPPRAQSPQTRIITAFPPEKLAEIGALEANGELLLVDDRLLVLQPGSEWDDSNNASIKTFDVKDPAKPEALWDLPLEPGQTLGAARLMGEQLFVVYRRNVDYSTPCPIPLFESRLIACDDIYHPERPTAVDTTYTVLKVDTKTGEIIAETTFLGSAGSSVVYMSSDALYITYSYAEDTVSLLFDYYLEADDLFPASLRQDLRRVNGYELSPEAKQVEMSALIAQWQRSLDEDEAKRVDNEMANRSEEFYKEHIRELGSTDIMRIELERLDLVAVGTVPGTPLNQFALDEYQDHLRIAVTVGSPFGNSGSVNDVYVLDRKLGKTGSVQDMGKGESIYAVRFIEDQGYVVTFRQTDPFYVLDLADAKKPRLSGELKIPGYSAYLHPLTTDLILGVGQEDWRVKLSVFDVSDPGEPEEVDNYLLDAYWTEIQDNHHGFLLDTKNEIFFFPADQDGYVFSYAKGEVKLEKVVTGVTAKRAIFLDNLLYVVGENGIVVLDESNWATVKTLSFT